MKKVRLITDGACSGNPGPGGWACVLRYGQHHRELFGSSPRTTNNRMELAAAIEGLRALREPCEVELTTDSEYLKNGITRWIRTWKRNGWKTSARKPVLNQDLWRALETAAGPHRVHWVWTKGHASHADNMRADELAVRAAETQSFSSGYRPGVESPKYALPHSAAPVEPG
ncbi:MAG: ribonuclease HI [Acidobacteria bacterium]|nr:ribonuclease HI [Acidobacteriota bacterium]